jgi:hypothetical protein
MHFLIRPYRRFTVQCDVTLPNEQRIEILDAVVRWARGQKFAVENISVARHTKARLHHCLKRLVREPTVIVL